MHPSKAFHWRDEEEMLDFARSTGWSRIFVQTLAGPRVAHVPLLIDRASRSLRFHVARSNAVHDALDGATALAVVEGPHAYVSASWYDDPAAHVPTWNYIAIEFDGRVKRVDDQTLVESLDQLAAINEAAVGGSWSRDALRREKFAAMLNAISGFEMKVEDIRGTRKLSQNQPASVRRLADGVEQSGGSELSDLMRASVR